MSRDWRARFRKFAIAIALGGVTISCWESIVLAQIIPDETLDDESSVVTPDTIEGIESDRISGGAARGSNLFHSFREFSIGEDRAGYFENPAAIKNIFSRVTGSDPSNILGRLGVLGNANLFFLNPNGILFGPNASLDVRGSFLTTTADGILFPDGNQFSATNPEAPPILTVNVQQLIGLQFEGKEGKIVNQAKIFLDSEQNLALIGGEVLIDGGYLATPGGRIEIGSVAKNSIVSLTEIKEGLDIGYEGVENFQDISLAFGALVQSYGENTGDVQVQGRNISLTEGSAISLNTEAGQAGDVNIIASESLTLDGNAAEVELGKFRTLIFIDVLDDATGEGSSININTPKLAVTNGAQIATTNDFGQGADININASEVIVEKSFIFEDPIEDPEDFKASGIFANVFDDGTGNGGNLTITTEKLTINEGAQISTSTVGAGNAGDLLVNAIESVRLIGTIPGTNNPSSLGADVGDLVTAIGDAGDLTVNTPKLEVRDGAQIGTIAQNEGNGGNLTLNISDSILLTGTSPLAELGGEGRSGIFVSVEPSLEDEFGTIIQSTGNGGNLSLSTKELIIEKGALISADTFSVGDAGDADINVNNLILRDGGQIGAGSLFGVNNIDTERGNGGTLNIDATESVEITGIGDINGEPVNSSIFTLAESNGNAGDITLKVEDSIFLAGDNSGLFANTEENSTGNSGSIFIDLTTVVVRDEAQIAVNSDGKGIGGNIDLQADFLTLDQGTITAETVSSQGGNINLTLSDLLTLRNNSQITATAGTAQSGGDGGNITIDAPFIIAFPQENSDISANAFEGDGGNIRINANGIFGIEFRDQETSLSDITASSKFGQQGEVEINTSVIDPTRGLNNLPQDTVEAKVAEGCQTAGGQPTLEFFDIGTGGLPPSPDELFSSEMVIAEWIPLDLADKKIQAPTSEKSFTGDEVSNVTLLNSFPCQK
ncbi:filamentous hemagglutinin N-terminal domain-containing protein [Pleurocapsa sp. PCC 7319]|uniref:two-partner secretion domain-containing protein n=1 Tax=Pleurocapsa sp. PCC 7319 TaxID=118161 RepID=UPI0003453CEF|nr:filamentous hemagglutinin N-terminal domain-containing protein [Pleurocapsa sp. PCC 7319]